LRRYAGIDVVVVDAGRLPPRFTDYNVDGHVTRHGRVPRKLFFVVAHNGDNNDDCSFLDII
jgi:hypothetical protein